MFFRGVTKLFFRGEIIFWGGVKKIIFLGGNHLGGGKKKIFRGGNSFWGGVKKKFTGEHRYRGT